MIDLLYNNISQPITEKIIDFYNYDFADKKRNYLWEETTSGLFLYRDLTSFFFCNSGKVYKLSRDTSDHGWRMHNEFYNMVSSLDDYRMEIPIIGKVVVCNNEQFFYSEIQRPNYELGVTFLEKYLTEENLTQFLIQHVEHTAVSVELLTKLNEKYHCNFPDVVPKVLFDAKGHFHSDFKNWHVPAEQATSKYVKKFSNYLNGFEQFNIPYNKEAVIQLATKLWNI